MIKTMYGLGSNVFIRKSTNENCEQPIPIVQPPLKQPEPSRDACLRACWPPEPENCELVDGKSVCLNGAWERGYIMIPK